MHEIFEKIRQQENGKSGFSAEKNWGRHFSKIPQDTYQITFEHNGQSILIQNKLGSESSGLFLCKMPERPKSDWFEIDERSVISKLINKKPDFLIVKTKNQETKQYIEESESFKHLNRIAKRMAFQPLIQGRNRDGFFTIETRYHLAFEERREVLEPMVDFYKELLDYLVQ